ncbi:MAG: HNH endonuclease signature motif containing protein [Candidatus Binatia bacterium]
MGQSGPEVGSRCGSSDFDDLDIVDPALLAPPDFAVRGSWRTDAGVVLDRELVALSGMQARCRLVQARLARRLIDRRAWKQLGFVRLGDYSRERLGLAPRTVEEDARVIRTLESLPVLAVALEAGAVTWSRVRVLVRVATAQNEGTLLRSSSSVSLRELDAFVREFARREAAGMAAGDAAATAGTSGADGAAAAKNATGADGTTATTDATATTATTDAAGHARATDATSKASGPRPDATASEIGAGDPAPASPSPDDDPELRWGIAVSRSGRRLWRLAGEMAARMEGFPLSPGQVLERVAAEAASGASVLHAGSSSGRCAAPPRWLPTQEAHERRLREKLHRQEDRGRRCLRAFLAETGVAEGFPWLEPASRDPGPARRLDALLDGLDHTDAFEIDRRLRLLRQAAQRIDFQMAALLYIGINRRLFREIGFATVRLYVESRLGCSARTVWSMVAVERESWRRSPLLRQAWRDGRISHLAAAALLPVISELNAEAWIRRAGEVTLRRLQDEVAWALDHGQSPSSTRCSGPPAPGADVRADGTGDIDPADVQVRATGPASDPSLEPAGAVRIECHVCLSVAVMVEAIMDRLQRDGEDRWQAFERMVAAALVEWTSQPRHRDPVFERDGWRCSVPGCSSRRNLHDHHVTYRSHGGGNSRNNRTTVCAAHHLHGIHAGIVRAAGRAPSHIVWELGCARGRKPLLRLLGDWVLER